MESRRIVRRRLHYNTIEEDRTQPHVLLSSLSDRLLETINRMESNSEETNPPPFFRHIRVRRRISFEDATTIPNIVPKIVLKTISVNNTNVEEYTGTCAVCLEDRKEGDECCLLPCEHKFHSNCIQQWVEVNATCPLCRSSLS